MFQSLARPVLTAAATAVLALSAAACSAGSAAPPASSATATRAAAAAAVAQPDTSAAARAVAQQFLALYSAGQWSAAWQFLVPADRVKVPESLYAAFHQGCPAEAAGMAYAIEGVTLAGTTAVVTYSIPVLVKLGDATLAMGWVPSGWGVELASDSLAEYAHGGLAADLAAARVAGKCAGS